MLPPISLQIYKSTLDIVIYKSILPFTDCFPFSLLHPWHDPLHETGGGLVIWSWMIETLSICGRDYRDHLTPPRLEGLRGLG